MQLKLAKSRRPCEHRDAGFYDELTRVNEKLVMQQTKLKSELAEAIEAKGDSGKTEHDGEVARLKEELATTSQELVKAQERVLALEAMGHVLNAVKGDGAGDEEPDTRITIIAKEPVADAS